MEMDSIFILNLNRLQKKIELQIENAIFEFYRSISTLFKNMTYYNNSELETARKASTIRYGKIYIALCNDS